MLQTLREKQKYQVTKNKIIAFASSTYFKNRQQMTQNVLTVALSEILSLVS